jgi:ABC-type protease/lipase transport system fused ATPase/permease subunit
MQQNPYIFNNSVMYNVRYGKPSATDEECRQACRRAGLHDVIMARKGGYDAMTGENGAYVVAAARRPFFSQTRSLFHVYGPRPPMLIPAQELLRRGASTHAAGPGFPRKAQDHAHR